jgi:hypothetical protein
MALDVDLIETEEHSLPLHQIVNGNGTPTIEYLNELRLKSRPEVLAIASVLRSGFGIVSEIGDKEAATAQAKCLRPATLQKYPWFSLAHIRDYLRFRTYLTKAEDFESVLDYFRYLRSRGIVSIVKVDTVKLARPGTFGWRMIATDLRIQSTGLIVEHYMTFGDMISINDAWLHKVYELWRSRSLADLTVREARNFDRDAAFSYHANLELFLAGILNQDVAGAGLAADRRRAADLIVGLLMARLNLQ